MSQAYDDWEAALRRRNDAKDALRNLVREIDSIHAPLDGADSIHPGDPTTVMVPSPSNWPTKDRVQQTVHEFNAAHKAEADKYNALSGPEEARASAKRQ